MVELNGNTVRWPKHAKLHQRWRRVTDAATVRRLGLWARTLPCLDSFGYQMEHIAFRTLTVPFYADHTILELGVPERFEPGFGVVAHLVPGLEVDGSDDAAPVLLNLTSPPIHEVNARLPIRLDDPAAAIAYLRFFCAYVWGEDGGFWIVDTPGDVPWDCPREAAPRREAEAAIQPARFIEAAPDHFRIDATVLYARALFRAKFKVQRTGMVEMMDDEPVSADLPAMADKHDGPVRLIG